MHRILFLSFFTFLSLFSFSQFTIAGKVIDAETKMPLQGASVFAQNTTKGVITNIDGDYSIYLKRGGYELVVSFTGYNNKIINIEATDDKTLDIELVKEDNSMAEVIVTASNEVADGWEKHGRFFIEHFIGSTPFSDSCILENPEALKFYFYKRSNKLKVLAKEPLQIKNNALGYSLRYQLDSFVYYNKTDINLYRGVCLYTAMEGDSAQQQEWSTARLKAYEGSRLHFLRSYYDSTLTKEGFTVDMLSSTDARKFNRLVNYYDSAYYYFDDSTGNAELFFPSKASIIYTKKAPDAKYLQLYNLPKDVKMQISYVDLSDAILIKPNGFFIDQRSWTSQGYWSYKNLADQLPYDYEPE